MKNRFLRLFYVCVLSVGLMISSMPLAVYAGVNDLMFASDSNAVTMFALPRSSVASVKNTIDWDGAQIRLSVYDSVLGIRNNVYLAVNNWATFDDSGISVKFSLDNTAFSASKYAIDGVGILLTKKNLPSPGNYKLSWDVSSAFSYSVGDTFLWSRKMYNNAEPVIKVAEDLNRYADSNSGDYALIDYPITLTSVEQIMPYYWILPETALRSVDFRMSVSFVPSSSSGTSTAGNDSITEDVGGAVSSSLSDMSSSMDEQAENIQEVADAIDELRGAMEPHYNNVLTQLHHVTEQLHALWDQQYNLHHVPLIAKLGDIITAIETMDVNITVDVDGLKSTINTMSTNIQNKLGSVQTALTNKLTSVQTGINNKLQNVQDGINSKLQNITDHITGGYDNSAMESEKSELSGSVEELEQAEKEVMDNVTGYLEDFEYPSFDSISVGVLASISFIGTFLQSLFLAIGDFGLIITFSLTMIFVLIIVGYHRIRT